MSFKFKHLAGKRVAVWGAGVEGLAALASLPSTAKISLLVDDPDDSKISSLSTRFGVPVKRPMEALSVDPPQVVVRSPGVSIRRPEIEMLRNAGADITSLLELWLPVSPAQCVVGITGTKGKSTTTKLVAELIAASGRSVATAGNMGIPVTEVESCDFAVIEVSSYQSAGIRISPKIGALTNLDIDHLPWHGSIGQYHRDKLQLFCNSELENLIIPPWAKVRVSELVPLLDLRPFEFEIDNSERLLRRGNSIVELRGTALESAHMARNLAVACAVSEEALKTPLDPVIVNEVAKKFILPTGRLEVIPSQDSFTWVNDPLASNPFAASAAVTTYSAKPIVLILGGEDRGVDPSSLIDAIRVHGQVRAVVLLGPVGKSWASLISHKTGLRLFHVETMEQAVEVGASLAYSGDVILFSPAAPTPKHEGNWETRLKQFRDSVLRINKGLDD